MTDIESIAKVIGGLTLFGIASKIYYDYKSGQIAKKKVNVQVVKKEMADAKRDIANLNLYELVKRVNKRFRGDSDRKGD